MREASGSRLRASAAGVFFSLGLTLAASLAAQWGLFHCGDPLADISYSTAVHDRNGTLLRLTLSGDEKYRLRAELGDYPRGFMEALLMKEDAFFFIHKGVNPVAILRAFWHTYVSRDYTSGGSTITMQLARLLYRLNTGAPAGKLTQMWRAVQLELRYSKTRILEAYCTLVPCGRNIEGFAAAALIYLKKSLGDLSLSETLLLCSLPQKPNERDPSTSTGVVLAARDRLYALWLARHPKDVSLSVQFSMPEAFPLNLPFEAPHAVDSLLKRRRGRTRIDSTIDFGLQKTIESIVSGYTERNRRVGITNACALLVRSRGMEVLAEVGSADFFDASIQGQVNGTEARRSPGSALKPFLYALAMDQSLIHPMTMLKDAPIHFSGYNPDNFDDEFEGPIKVRDALIRSRNVPAVALMQKVKDPDLYDFLSRAGIARLRPRDDYGVSLILGTAEVTMKELVSLYGILANGGDFQPLRETLNDALPAAVPGFYSAQAAYLVVDILRQKARPSEIAPGTLLRRPEPVAWKTGTSIGFRDAWTVAIFDSFVLAVWVGNFDGSGDPAFVGLTSAAPLAFEIIDAVRAGGLGTAYTGDQGVREPEGIITVKVCAISGKLPNDDCPVTVDTLFIPGRSPIDVCDIHKEIHVDTQTGLRRAAPIEGRTESAVYEIWPSDLLDLFTKAGLPRRPPPPFAPEDASAAEEGTGTAPQILSPLHKGEYAVRIGEQTSAEIPFMAVIPSETAEVFWFLNESFVAKTARGKAYFWTPTPGDYVLRAIDERGRSASSRFRVVVSE